MVTQLLYFDQSQEALWREVSRSPPSPEHNRGMRVKTSVTLPSALLKEIDRLDGNRSAFLERAAVAYIGKQIKSDLDARDAAILDRVAGELNEQSDVLEF
jgi:hypothetical protein